MMKVLKNSSNSACRLSWLLVEVHDGVKVEYHCIHFVEVLGDFNDVYVSKKVRFMLERRECTGTLRLASDYLKVIEGERDRLMAHQEELSKNAQPLKPNLWCLVRQTTDEDKVRLIIVSCKKLTCIESPDLKRRHFFMQKDHAQVPTTLLHIIESEQELQGGIAFLNNSFTESFLCEEKDREVESGGLQQAFFLVQYFEDTHNLVYTIVHYRDTIWKEKNLFPNMVAYISDGKTASQCVILRKSYRREELVTLLSQIRESCDKVDYPLLHSQLKKSAIAPEGNREVSNAG